MTWCELLVWVFMAILLVETFVVCAVIIWRQS